MSHILLLFSKPDAYINHNAPQSLSEITGGTLSDYKQLPLEPQKGFILLFFTNAQVLPKTSKHKFMCKNGEDMLEQLSNIHSGDTGDRIFMRLPLSKLMCL